MLTQHTRSRVSAAAEARGLVLAAALFVSACAGRQHPIEQIARADVLEFDNEATVYVDVYLVANPTQWRLGRVPAGMRVTLNVPEPALDWTTGFVQLIVIPASQISADASRDPRAVVAIAQPVSELLSQQWSFRQPAGAALQLQPKRLVWRQ